MVSSTGIGERLRADRADHLACPVQTNPFGPEKSYEEADTCLIRVLNLSRNLYAPRFSRSHSDLPSWESVPNDLKSGRALSQR